MTTVPIPLVVTTETIAGMTIVGCLGYVEGHGGTQPGAGQSQVTGSPIEGLQVQAARMGANAVVAVRWSLTERGDPWVYGTAVVAAKND